MREQVQQAVLDGWEIPTRERAIGSNDQHDGLRRFPPASPSEWIGEIQRQFTQGRSATLELARTVFAAKCRLHHGEWAAILKSGRLPFRKRRAETLVVIGNGLGWLEAPARRMDMNITTKRHSGALEFRRSLGMAGRGPAVSPKACCTPRDANWAASLHLPLGNEYS